MFRVFAFRDICFVLVINSSSLGTGRKLLVLGCRFPSQVMKPGGCSAWWYEAGEFRQASPRCVVMSCSLVFSKAEEKSDLTREPSLLSRFLMEAFTCLSSSLCGFIVCDLAYLGISRPLSQTRRQINIFHTCRCNSSLTRASALLWKLCV